MKHIQKHFEKIARDYDFYKQRNRNYYNCLKKAVSDNIKIKKPKILDIGCGTGEVLNFLKPNIGIGIDISREMIKIARQKYYQQKNLSFVVHNIENKPFKGNFSYVLLNDVIEHLEDKDKAIKNIQKSMGKNSILILSMANPFWEPLLLILEKLKLKMPEGPHFRISERDLFDLLRKNKLEAISKEIYFPKINLPYLKNLGLIYVYTIKKN